MNGSDNVRDAFERAEDIYPGDFDPRTPLNGAPRDPEDNPNDEIARQCAALPLNDFGNGKRFTAYFGENVIFVPRVGWFVWDGRCWTQDDDQLEVRRKAQCISGKITREAAHICLEDWEVEQLDLGAPSKEALDLIMVKKVGDRTDSEKSRMRELKDAIERADALKKKLGSMRTGHHSHAKAAGNSGPINNMMGEAQVDVFKPLTAMNIDPLMINTQTNVIRFSEVVNAAPGGKKWKLERLPHARDQLLSKMMPVDYDPAVQCPQFLAFLASIHPSSDMRDFLQMWFGYSLTGRTDEQKLVFFHGGGRNGKSTLVDLIAKMMGPYATTVPIESLTGADTRKGADATPDLVRLPGARMVRASEPERGQKMKEAMIKQLTGGEAILVRRMMQEFIEVTPEFKLTISGNHKPDIRGTDDGIWRRMLLVPFDVQIAEADVDPLLSHKLWTERSGILNWLLEGCAKWLENNGLKIPDEIIKATNEYRGDCDDAGMFIEGCCIVDGDHTVVTRALVLTEALNWWQKSNAGTGWTPGVIKRRIADKADGGYKSPDGHEFKSKKSNFACYSGIRLSKEFLDRREDAASDARYGAGVGEPDYEAV